MYYYFFFFLGGGGIGVSPRGLGTIGDVRRQGEGGYLKKWKIGETSFMDGP